MIRPLRASGTGTAPTTAGTAQRRPKYDLLFLNTSHNRLTSKLQSPEAVEAVPASVELGRPIYFVYRVMNFFL